MNRDDFGAILREPITGKLDNLPPVNDGTDELVDPAVPIVGALERRQ
jgi:hypothetical protein